MFRTDVTADRKWEECPREMRGNKWNTLYATLNPAGELVISRFTHEMMGCPKAYVLLFERDSYTIGLRPAREDKPEINAYPAGKRGRHGGRRVFANRLCREIGVSLPETVRFDQCHIDQNGILVLDLRKIVPTNRRGKGGFKKKNSA